MTPRKLNPRTQERILYALIILSLAVYGLKDSAAAVALMGAVKEAFTLLLQQP